MAGCPGRGKLKRHHPVKYDNTDHPEPDGARSQLFFQDRHFPLLICIHLNTPSRCGLSIQRWISRENDGGIARLRLGWGEAGQSDSGFNPVWRKWLTINERYFENFLPWTVDVHGCLLYWRAWSGNRPRWRRSGQRSEGMGMRCPMLGGARAADHKKTQFGGLTRQLEGSNFRPRFWQAAMAERPGDGRMTRVIRGSLT